MALIIVLAFVVLLTALTVAYFSQTTADRQIAQSSFNQSNADQLASSAVGIIVGDLRQEIIAGSNAASFGPSPTASPYYLYTPISPSNMVPKRSGTPTSGAPIPILYAVALATILCPLPGCRVAHRLSIPRRIHLRMGAPCHLPAGTSIILFQSSTQIRVMTPPTL
jgi:hypothetical protein